MPDVTEQQVLDALRVVQNPVGYALGSHECLHR